MCIWKLRDAFVGYVLEVRSQFGRSDILMKVSADESRRQFSSALTDDGCHLILLEQILKMNCKK